MNPEVPNELPEEQIDHGRRGFLRKMMLASAGLAVGGMHAKDAEAGEQRDPNLEAHIDEIARKIVQNETIMNELAKLSDQDLQDINDGVFAGDPLIYQQHDRPREVLEPAELDITTPMGALGGLAVGAALGKIMPPLSSDGEVGPVAPETVLGVGGAVVGGVIGRSEFNSKMERHPYLHHYSGILGEILGRYRREGKNITRADVAQEISLLQEKNASFREERDTHKKFGWETKP